MEKTAREEERCTCFHLTRLESGMGGVTDLPTSVFWSFLLLLGYSFLGNVRENRLIAPLGTAMQEDGSPFSGFLLIGDPIVFRADSNCTRALALEKVVLSPSSLQGPSSILRSF